MHGYYSTCAFMHNFTPTDVGVFWIKTCKMRSFFYFARLCIHISGCSNYNLIKILDGYGNVILFIIFI